MYNVLKPQQSQSYKIFNNDDKTIFHITDENHVTSLLCSTDAVPKSNNNVVAMITIEGIEKLIVGNVFFFDDFLTISTSTSKLFFSYKDCKVVGVVKKLISRNIMN